MGLWAAAPYLVAASLKNRLRSQLRRLKSPKYLIGAAVGLFYLWSLFVRRLVMSPPSLEGLSADALLVIEALMLVGGLMVVLSAWLFGSNSKSALRYNEAEIQFLFAGPVSRGQLLHFKLLRTLAQTLASAVITTLLFGRSLAGHPGFFITGSFITLGAIALHVTGASLTREALGKHGRYGLLHRAFTLLGVAAALGGIGWWVFVTAKPVVPDGLEKEAWVAWLRALLDSGPLRLVLWPFRAPLAVALAQDGSAFLRALPGGLAVLAANYLWVMRSDHAFEESAVQSSERWARRREAWRNGQRTPAIEPRPFRLKLAAQGRPEIALAWKALAGLRRMLRLGVLPILLALLFTGGMLVYGLARDQSPMLPLAGSVILVLIGGFTALVGPTGLPIDLRRDLQHLEVLRSWPLSGRQLVAGALLGPFVVLTLAQWACWVAAFLLSLPVEMAEVPVSLRGALALGAMLVGPALTATTLVLVNGAVLLFPAWVSAQPRRGVEAMGQRILALAGGLLILTVGILPATLVGGAVFFLFAVVLKLGTVAVAAAAVAASAVLFTEVAVAIHGMGLLFDRLDLTE